MPRIANYNTCIFRYQEKIPFYQTENVHTAIAFSAGNFGNLDYFFSFWQPANALYVCVKKQLK